jgi:hypothetical protein
MEMSKSLKSKWTMAGWNNKIRFSASTIGKEDGGSSERMAVLPRVDSGGWAALCLDNTDCASTSSSGLDLTRCLDPIFTSSVPSFAGKLGPESPWEAQVYSRDGRLFVPLQPAQPYTNRISRKIRSMVRKCRTLRVSKSQVLLLTMQNYHVLDLEDN